jgi:hypothetical protein
MMIIFFFLSAMRFRNNSIEAEQSRFIQDVGRRLERKWNPRSTRYLLYKFSNGSTRSLQQVSAYCVRRPIISLRQHFHDGTRAVFPCYIAYMSQSCEFHACLKWLLQNCTQRNSTCRRAIHNQMRTRQFPIYFKSPALLIRVYANVLSYIIHAE